MMMTIIIIIIINGKRDRLIDRSPSVATQVTRPHMQTLELKLTGIHVEQQSQMKEESVA